MIVARLLLPGHAQTRLDLGGAEIFFSDAFDGPKLSDRAGKFFGMSSSDVSVDPVRKYLDRLNSALDADLPLGLLEPADQVAVTERFEENTRRIHFRRTVANETDQASAARIPKISFRPELIATRNCQTVPVAFPV